MNKNVEIWKDIPGYEGLYQVSNLGRVYSLPKEWVNSNGGINRHNGKILKAGVSRGYKHVTLCYDAIKKTYKIHQLVAIAFLNHKKNGGDIVVDHINNDSLDNRVENLQIITQRKNASKDKKNKTSKYTGVHWCNKRNKWKSSIMLNGKETYLGSFKCEIEASQYYENALKSFNNNTEIKVKKPVFTSKYKGVMMHKKSNKWQCQISINGKQKHIGLFKCELSAHHAYQKALNECS